MPCSRHCWELRGTPRGLGGHCRRQEAQDGAGFGPGAGLRPFPGATRAGLRGDCPGDGRGVRTACPAFCRTSERGPAEPCARSARAGPAGTGGAEARAARTGGRGGGRARVPGDQATATVPFTRPQPPTAPRAAGTGSPPTPPQPRGRTQLSSRPPPGDTAWRRHLLRSAPGSRSCFHQHCRTTAREILLDLTGSAPDPGPECTPMVAVREAAPARQTCDCMSDRKHVIRHMCVCVCVCALSLTETLASYIICIKWILREKNFFLICGFPIFFYSDPQLMNCQAYLQKYVYIFSFHISEFLVPQSTSS